MASSLYPQHYLFQLSPELLTQLYMFVKRAKKDCNARYGAAWWDQALGGLSFLVRDVTLYCQHYVPPEEQHGDRSVLNCVHCGKKLRDCKHYTLRGRTDCAYCGEKIDPTTLAIVKTDSGGFCWTLRPAEFWGPVVNIPTPLHIYPAIENRYFRDMQRMRIEGERYLDQFHAANDRMVIEWPLANVQRTLESRGYQ